MTRLTLTTVRPHELSEHELGDLINGVRAAFVTYAPGSNDGEIRARLLGHGKARVELALCDNKVGGFLVHSLITLKGQRIDYHDGVSLLPSFRRRGIYKTWLTRSIRDLSPDWIVGRTQNPAIYESWRRFAIDGDIYPRPGVPVPSDIFALAEHLSEGRLPVARDTLVVKDAHGFVAEDRTFMTADDRALTDFFGSSLARDDGFMVIARVTHRRSASRERP